jgi:hypothetical protein
MANADVDLALQDVVAIIACLLIGISLVQAVENVIATETRFVD